MSIHELYPNEHEFDIKLDLKRALISILNDKSVKTRLSRIRTVWVLKQRFWHNKTLREIGDEMGVSPERIRQYEAKGLRLLKHPKHGLRRL